MLTSTVAAVVRRRVLDATELKGIFDITLRWDANLAVTSDEPAATRSDSPSIFTAVQEQLGLRLESSKAPTKVLVIDSVERPTEN